ncbi:glycosyltransferase family 4 protein [Phreatobacter stygius]|uniref:Glycosyltransferase family 4 protein n=1 Tax=Phreatobacter stygius TaxID=1940610 RepID=A0A4D7B2H2_9HYPH|nr:glycosyltransferase family 4 protein [Phreatobacter stygius]QCI64270.1 glycosyltransferase family 4 protein [Phreatobacter stygius]
MTRAVFAIPGDLSLPTGGYRYDREVLARAAAHGLELGHLGLPGSFPFPDESALDITRTALASLAPQTVLLADGLAYGAFPEALCAAVTCPIAALVHHPLALESGLSPAAAAALKASETIALGHARAVIVPSPTTARILVDDYRVAAAKITIAEPGTARAARATGSGGTTTELLAVGAISPRKGYGVLVAALGQLKELDWHLTIAGATDRAPATVAELQASIDQAGLAGRIALAGAVDDGSLDKLYAAADLFVMPSLFEGYGMVLTEAMARGLPIVTTTGGAAAETVPDAAALKVPPADEAALRDALATALKDRGLRARLAEASWAAARALPTWDDTARVICEVLGNLAARTMRP